MEHLLIKYGYFVLFLGVAVEGEGFLLVASFMAHRGYLYLPVVMLVALPPNVPPIRSTTSWPGHGAAPGSKADLGTIPAISAPCR